MKFRLAGIAAVLFAAGTLSAQSGPRPQGGPASGARKRASAPSAAKPNQEAPRASRTITLNNGMQATFIHVGAARKAFVSLVLETGEIDEPAFGPGLAALTADILLQGTVARPAQAIVKEAESLGTKLDVRAGPVTTTLSGDVDATRIPRFLSLVADMVRHPLLDTAGFGRVQRHAMRALDSTLKNPADLARQQWRAIVFPDGPFGHPYSYAATLGLLKLGHVRNVYDDNYAASRAHLYVSGGFDDAAAERAVRDIFSDWKRGSPPKPVAIHSATVHELVTLDQPGATHSVTWIGLPTIDASDPEFAKLEVADMLVAGDDSSRVALDLASMSETAPHGVSTLWQRRHATYWVSVIDVPTANTAAALGAVVGELSVLKKNPPGEAEVARARGRVLAAFEARNNSREGLVALAEFMEEHALGDEWRAEYVKRVMAVTPEDVRSAVERFLDPAHMATVIVGDRESIDAQLAKLRPLVP